MTPIDYGSYTWPTEGGAGVTSINGLTGAVILAAGAGISIAPAGNTLTIATSALLAAITSINSDTTSAQILSVGTAGSDFAVTNPGAGSHVFNLPTASASNRGALSSADWTTFNNKQAALTIGNLTDAGTDGITVTGGTGAVIGSGASLSQHVADTTHNGYLSSIDWTTFNNKQSALTFGDLTDAGADGITVTGGSGAVIGLGVSLSQRVADTTHNGYLSSADWNTFSGKQSTITVGALDAQAANASGLSLTANVISTQSATNSFPGLVSVGAQSFAGLKTFGDGIAGVGSALTSFSIDTSNTITVFDSNFSIQDNVDSTKQFNFILQNQTTGTTSNFTTRGTANRTYNLPDVNITFSGFSSTPAAHTVVLGSGTNNLTSTSAGSAGQPLLSGGSGANPDWGTLGISFGGTGQVTKSAAFDALSPMTTGGDLIYGGASGTGTRLANGSAGQFLQSNGTTLAPTWVAGLTNPMTTLGDIIYENATPVPARLAGNTTATINFLSQTGTGSVSAAPAWSAFVAPTVQKFITGTAQTYTTSTSPRSPLYIRVRMVGGGGGGGGAGNSGGSVGNDGTDTTFKVSGGGALLVAGKGGGGGSWTTNNAGSGGTASLGSGPIGTALSGASGVASLFGQVATAAEINGGAGGNSAFGGGGSGGHEGTNAVAGATNTGAGGGGGGVTVANTGGGGGGGAGGYVDAIITSPAATYEYTVGGGGTKGSNGTSAASSPANGADGYIEVTEYYQ